MREDGRESQEVLEGVDIYSFKKNKSKSEKTVEHSFFKKSFIVIQLQLYAFSPHPSTPPQYLNILKAQLRYNCCKINVKKVFIVIQLQLYAFSPHPSTPPQPNLPPSPLILSMCPL